MSGTSLAGEHVMSYRHNGRGERVYRQGLDRTVHTVFDPAGRWIGDYDAEGAIIQQAIWFGDLPVGLLARDGGTTRLFHVEPDMLGSPRVVIDPTRGTNGTVVWRWDLAGEAFGNDTPSEDPDGDGTAFVLDMRFPGQQYDSASGLNYNYFRDYEAATGRYVESDPIGLNGGISIFAYADSNPLRLMDRLGLKSGASGENADCEECAPGRERFDSRGEAARSVLRRYFLWSLNNNVEVCGLICRDEKTTKFFIPSHFMTGDSRTCSPGSIPCPKCSRAAGWWHTHGAPDGWRHSDAERFSTGEQGDTTFTDFGAGFWGDPHFTGFLATPQGWFWSYYANSQIGPIRIGRLFP